MRLNVDIFMLLLNWFRVELLCICWSYSNICFILQGKARKVVVVGGGYIGMEVAAAAVGWKLDTTVRM